MKNEIVNIYTEDNQTIITFEFKTQENYDQIASGALKQECPEFIMPMRFNENYEIAMMRYMIDEQYISIRDIDEELSIENVLNLYEVFLTDLEMCEDWYLNLEGICYEPQYVYLDKTFKQLKLLYVPNSNRIFDAQALKNIFMDLLGKCSDESGSTIQLQLYKYFYKPQFDLIEFKEMLQVLQKDMERTKDEIKKEKVQEDPHVMQEKNKVEEVTPVVVQTEAKEEGNDIKEKVEEIKLTKDEQFHRTTYSPRNKSQLSQEEIEEMVKSIYRDNAVDLKNIVPNQKQEEVNMQQVNKMDKAEEKETKASFYTAKKVEVQEESETKSESTTSFYSRKTPNSVPKEKTVEGKKSKRSLFESVFTSGKNNKTVVPTMPQVKGIRLESISKPTRYDLPEEILLDCEEKAFVIGRKSREPKEQVADFEFGVEITPISYMHVQIEKKADGYYLTDLGSNNGTFINGNKIEAHKPYVIQHEDKIALAIAFSKNSIEYIFLER